MSDQQTDPVSPLLEARRPRGQASLRPRSLTEFVGQRECASSWNWCSQSALRRGGAPDHVLCCPDRPAWARPAWR